MVQQSGSSRARGRSTSVSVSCDAMLPASAPDQASLISQVDAVIRETLLEFLGGLHACDWRGKENDFINRYAHGFLLQRCSQESFLYHPTQIGIEVAVPQPPGIGIKPAVKKDLVIWPRAWMSCWDASWRPLNKPLTVLEWKVVRGRGSGGGDAHDHNWLTAFSSFEPRFVGFSVILSVLPTAKPHLTVRRYQGGKSVLDWLTG